MNKKLYYLVESYGRYYIGEYIEDRYPHITELECLNIHFSLYVTFTTDAEFKTYKILFKHEDRNTVIGYYLLGTL